MTEKFNGQMLQLARESRALTQAQLAKASGLSQPYLSRLEAMDEFHPATAVVESLAQVLRFPIEFFFSAERRTGVGVSTVFYRRKSSSPAIALRQTEALVNLRRIQITRLLEEVETDFPFSIENLDPETFGEPEKIARLVRASWKLPSGPVTNLTQAVERAGGVVLKEVLPYAGIDGMSHWLPPAPPIFLLNAHVSTDRLRMSLAHELGHATMHSEQPTADVERDAKNFAAEFLMPAQEVASDLVSLTLRKAAQLKPIWKVSMAALIVRANTLRIITEHQYKGLMIELSRSGYRMVEPVEIPDEEPRVLSLILQTHSDGLGRTSAEIAKRALMSEEDFLTTLMPGRGRIRIVPKRI